MIRFFRCAQLGAAVFGISDGLTVWRIGAYQGAVAQAGSMWPAEGIVLLEVTDDVAGWLGQLPIP